MKEITPPSGSLSAKSLSLGGDNLPHYHQRAFAHNYHAPFIYHIILKKRDGFEKFGSLKGNASIPPGSAGCAYIEKTAIGRIIVKSIFNIPVEFPILKVYQFTVMPDHVHILLRVKGWSEQHLDYYIGTLVSNIATIYSGLLGHHISADEIFQPGYCDKPLLLNRSLNGLFRYIRENPHRLAIRRQFPQYFQRVHQLRIADNNYEGFGNSSLFQNPEKLAVKISRNFTSEEKRHKTEYWLTEACKGSILVSPFISKDEKAIRAEAEAIGARIILITHKAFGERFKPSAHDFMLCSQGRLLIITLGQLADTPLSRSTCLSMNSLAHLIASL